MVGVGPARMTMIMPIIMRMNATIMILMQTCHVTVARLTALQTKAPVMGGTGIATLA